MVSDELLPCPFCGGEDVTVVSFGPHAHNDYESDAFVKCDRCGASGPEVREPVPLGEAEDMALAAWNRRAGTHCTRCGKLVGE
nr:Lar family restriction alleviation protein [uncultured Olsenella sp.]